MPFVYFVGNHSMKERLGIIDWGIGGVSIYKLVREQIGDVPVIYFSDTGATPYGKMTRRELTARLNTVIDFLETKGVTHLIIGCNAASTSIPFVKKAVINLEGVIEPAVSLIAKLKPQRLGLIGGRRTVLSGAYRKAFAKVGIEVEQRIAQPLSGLIESGDVSSPTLRDECKRILAPLQDCSHILLACTHYPAIGQILKEFVSPETKFVDPVSELVRIISHWKLDTGGDTDFLTTGDVNMMKRAARNAFGVDIRKISKINLG